MAGRTAGAYRPLAAVRRGAAPFAGTGSSQLLPDAQVVSWGIPMFGRKLSPAEVAILETFVVPRYLALFGELALELLLSGEEARIVHLGCRTGYPDRQLIDRIDGSTVVGVDSSLAAVELARNKAATLVGASLEYRVEAELPTELEGESFSHALTLHPAGSDRERLSLFAEMARLLYSGGQALVALPLRGSFQELMDLVREYALKHDDGELGKAVEVAALTRPGIEELSEELESVGLEDVDVEVRQTTLRFDGGRAFTEDPVTRVMIVPELQALVGAAGFADVLAYVGDAIDKYWADQGFELSLKVGAASARKP